MGEIVDNDNRRTVRYAASSNILYDMHNRRVSIILSGQGLTLLEVTIRTT